MNQTSLQYEREQIARAVSWTAYLFNGRFNKTLIACSTFEEAMEQKLRLDREVATNTRRAIIYAITPEKWSIQVTADNFEPYAQALPESALGRPGAQTAPVRL